MTDDLIARLEAAEGPSRELDALIRCALFKKPSAFIKPYTFSIDAALTLVPEGWEWTIESGGHVELVKDRMRGPYIEGNAVTPALAICIAALRALKGTDNDG